jgi:hypothetical protein
MRITFTSYSSSYHRHGILQKMLRVHKNCSLYCKRYRLYTVYKFDACNTKNENNGINNPRTVPDYEANGYVCAAKK